MNSMLLCSFLFVFFVIPTFSVRPRNTFGFLNCDSITLKWMDRAGIVGDILVGIKIALVVHNCIKSDSCEKYI